MLYRYLLGLSVVWLVACERQVNSDAVDLNAALGGQAQQGFQRADTVRPFVFPQDYGAHPQFRNEWWYVTGNVQAQDGRHFGYQVTWFRIALSSQPPQNNNSPWAAQQLWMAHVALTDVASGEHLHEERLARGAAGLAGQTQQPFRVWLEDWQLLGNTNAEFPWALQIKAEEFALNLQLRPQKPLVLQGEQGLSQKSAQRGNASYYYSFTRLQTIGEIYRDGERFEVMGNSWLDREWSTSVLSDEQTGWDWFSLQFADGQELMVYQLRNTQGQADAFSYGRWVFADGSGYVLGKQDFTLQPLRYWQAADGRRYPVEWQLTLAAQQQTWRIEALLDDQQMQTMVTYWEGAVRIVNQDDQLQGYGYLEMSGY